MKLLLDENLSPAYVQWARRQGHDAVSILEAGLAGENDTRVMEYATKEQRVLVTLAIYWHGRCLGLRIYQPVEN